MTESNTTELAAVQAAATAIAPLSIKDTVLAQFKEAEASLTSLADRYRNVAYDTTTPKGMREAIAARADLRDNGRLFVTRAEKRIKADVNDLKRVMADEVVRLVGIVEPVEESIDKQIKAEEERKAAEKAERERIEAERVGAHRANIDKLKSYVVRAEGQPVDAIERAIQSLQALQIGAEWEEFADEALTARVSTVEALQKQVANERQRLENERLAQELADARAALEAERAANAAAERIRAEEAANLQREAEAKGRAEAAELARQRDEALAQQRREDQARQLAAANAEAAAQAAIAQAAMPAPAPAPAAQAQAAAPAAAQMFCCPTGKAQELANRACDECAEISAGYQAAMFSQSAPAAPADVDDGNRINLGAINEHLAPIRLDAAGLEMLGFVPVATVKASKLYRASDLPAIRGALVEHLNSLDLQPA